MRRPRVLLVDDDVTITRALSLYLSQTGGCDVQVENRGSRALETARAFRPDLIFLDIVMPDADGGSIAAAIDADATLRGTPVVFLTALVSTRQTGGSSTRIGKHPFLAKPVHPSTILQCVKTYASA